jgi:uncharacterized membrane protein YqgA involved in biofilm formation
MTGLGTLINLAAVAVGGMVGIFAGHRLPDRVRVTIMRALGLVTLAVGIVGMEPLFAPGDTGLRRFIILIIAMTLGGTIGEFARLESRLEGAGERLKRRFGVEDETLPGASSSPFVEGFVLASTVFCVGPLTVLGALEDGLGISVKLLAIKSALDGIAAIGFASIYGWGVLASLITIAIVQGGITLAAGIVDGAMTTEVLAMVGATGSLLIVGIGLRLLDVARVPILNLMPAVVLGPLLAGLYEAW